MSVTEATAGNSLTSALDDVNGAIVVVDAAADVHASVVLVTAADDVHASSGLDVVHLAIVVVGAATELRVLVVLADAADDVQASSAFEDVPVIADADDVIGPSVVDVIRVFCVVVAAGARHPPTGQSFTEVAANMSPE
jgi:hypothetical protein